MQTKSFFLFDDGFSALSGRFWCSCASESHEHSSGAGCSVEMYASYLYPVSIDSK